MWLIVFAIYGHTPSVPPIKKKLFISGQIYRNDAHCYDNDFLVRQFFFNFFEIWSILYIVDFDVCDLMYAKLSIYEIDHISKTKSRTKNSRIKK